ncbi:MAG: sugar phosphate isomerase/epimerase [Verrucomicrobiales bacterium]|nr:sugar phosphate isomerase/epimerase [Verrucomicrobiales bacterium]
MTTASTLEDYSRLCVHTITTKAWSIEEAMDRYVAAGIGGITVWQDALKQRKASLIGEQLRARDLSIVSLCRGGFFPAKSAQERQQSINDNRRSIELAAELGAPSVVLVCGAVPGQSLDTSRQQISEGIAAILPDAEAAGIRLSIEPLHPMYADDRSAINSMAQANQLCDQFDHPLLGIAVDVYHLWWDDQLEQQIQIAAKKQRLFAFHICDWMTPTTDLLNDRGLMGEGCIPVKTIRNYMETNGFNGFNEVEIFSNRWWQANPEHFLQQIQQSYLKHS